MLYSQRDQRTCVWRGFRRKQERATDGGRGYSSFSSQSTPRNHSEVQARRIPRTPYDGVLLPWALLGSHIETLVIYKLSSRKFTTQNDLYESYSSKRLVILTETKFIDYVFANEIRRVAEPLPSEEKTVWKDRST